MFSENEKFKAWYKQQINNYKEYYAEKGSENESAQTPQVMNFEPHLGVLNLKWLVFNFAVRVHTQIHAWV